MTTNVAFRRREYLEQFDRWSMIRDCLIGETAVKKAGIKYLPQPNAEDKSPANTERYNAYKQRAVFYNVARRTLEGLVGQVFAAEPVIDVPDEVLPMLANASGTGISAVQVAKQSLRDVVGYGRAGLFVDFPRTSAPITRAQLLSGEYHPTLVRFDAFQIINWRTKMIDGQQRLSLVVLRDVYDHDNGYEITSCAQLRVLRLDEDNLYVVDVYRTDATTAIDDIQHESFLSAPTETYMPVDYSGQRIKVIPFWFMGSNDNDTYIDQSPLYDLCALNIAHYRNSADYEDSCFMVGQPTPWVSGLTQAWVDKNMNGLMQLGSRGVIPLPQGGAAGLLQVSPNTMPMEAMQHKERQMVALGAKLVESRSVQRTLGEAQMEAATETSVLSSAAYNISSAFTDAVRFATQFFYGIANTEDTWVTLSTDFAISKMSPQERAELIKEWQAGAISFSEMRDQLRQSGIATLDDEDAKEEIDEEMANRSLALDPVIEADPADPAEEA